MTNETCPRCDCTTLKYQENYGYWEFLDCGHVWALDADDPDYDESNMCPVCLGSGKSSLIEECPICEGSGNL
ncbi:MAG: hypothetical protein V7K27_09915 [Nostoc sp.]|uniref:hypothetical protein n=1 Tax=Nostoc sp. TaxID=1180 RepID=UPI002FF575AB